MHAKPETQVNRINFCDECDDRWARIYESSVISLPFSAET
jgi:hypothetical protein